MTLNGFGIIFLNEIMEGNILANRSKNRSELDFYKTPEKAIIPLLKFLDLPYLMEVCDPCCGTFSITDVLKNHFHRVIAFDIKDYGSNLKIDFLERDFQTEFMITNPPFNKSELFIKKAWETVTFGFAFLLKSQYWHAKSRTKLFNEYRPTYILPLNFRPNFDPKRGKSPTMDCLWTVWLKKNKDFCRYEILSV